MNPVIPYKKLFRIALYTSTAIGLITVGPAYIIGITIGNITISTGMLLKLISISVVGISFLVFLFWTFNIALFYLSNRNPLSHQNRNTRYVWSYFVCFLLMFIMRFFTSPLFIDSERQQQIFNWKIREFGIDPYQFNYTQFNNGIFQTLMIIFVVLSINTVIIIILDLVLLEAKKTKVESENTQLRIKNMEAANLRLKQQLQPHFLFNSLNVLKTLVRKQPGNAETYIKRLSDFLRASVSFDNANTVTFKEELKLSLDYIEMQKIRFGEAIRFEVYIPEEVRTGLLPVFSIQLLLENAIKHNAFTTESPLNIKLSCKERWITVSNNIQQKAAEESSTGMGLLNLSDRYKMLSGDNIDIKTNGSDFSVSIKILSDEDSNH